MADNSANNKRLAKNSLFLSIRMMFVLILSLYSTRTLLSALGVEDYGVFNVVCGFVSMFAFLNTSLSNGIQRFFNYELGKNGIEGAREVYSTALIIQALLAISLTVIVEIFGLWYIPNKMVIPDGRLLAAQWIFQFVIASFILNIMQAPYTAAVMAHERMDFYAIVSIIDALFKLLIILVLPYLHGDSLIWYGFLWMLISTLNWAIYYLYSKKNFDEIRFKREKNKKLFGSMVGFSGWNMFGTISSVLREQGLNLIMNLFFGPVVNAARGVASQINGGIQSFVQNITTPVRPQVIQSFAIGNVSRSMNLTYSISKLSCYFISMLAIPICYEIDFILKIWIGDNIPQHTSSFAVIIIACSFQGNLNAALSTIVHATGKMRNYQVCCSLIKIMSIPISFCLLSANMAAEVALICVFIFDWLGHFAGMFVLRSLVSFSIKDYIRNVLFPIITVLVISVGCTYPLHHYVENDIIRFIIVTFSGIVLVLISMFTIGLQRNEKDLIFNIIRPLIKKNKND